jgi:hypothetical protein
MAAWISRFELVWLLFVGALKDRWLCEQPTFIVEDTSNSIQIYEGNSISKLQIQVANYVFELSAGNCQR